MKKYTIVTNSKIMELESEVNRLLNEGWQVAGGISMTYKHVHSEQGHLPGHLEYAQALQREEAI